MSNAISDKGGSERAAPANLRHATAEYYKPVTLTSAQLGSLQSALRRGEKSRCWKTLFSSPGWSVAALLFLILLPFGLWQTQHVPLTQAIADEVVRNHIKLKPLEVSGKMTEVADYFSLLPFRPFLSGALNKSWQLEGARYCSVQGVDAAQLRFSAPDERRYSLYQVRLHHEHWRELPAMGAPPLQLERGGLQVRIWREKEVLQVLVGH